MGGLNFVARRKVKRDRDRHRFVNRAVTVLKGALGYIANALTVMLPVKPARERLESALCTLGIHMYSI